MRPTEKYDAWGFDGCTRAAGRDHAVPRGSHTTLCGLSVNPTGYPTGEPFRRADNYVCGNCRRVVESFDRKTGDTDAD